MAITENTAGAGALAGVAWTPMEGTRLTAPMLAAVNNDVATATSMAEALLEAANGAFNLGWQTLSLSDLAAGAGLGERLLLQRTQLQGSPNQDSPADWSAFLGRALGSAPAPDEPMSLAQWRQLASDLQRFAALQASRRTTSEQSWGGVAHANGQWFVNGQALSLQDLFTAVRVNQVANLDEFLSGLTNDISANNALLEAAREWMATIRSKQPTGSANGQITTGDRNTFIAKWGYDPTVFSNTIAFDSGQSALTFDRWLNSLKTYVDLKSTENQTLQVDLGRKADRRSEAIEAIVSFLGKSDTTGSLMANNLG